ncbi:hypothetical protein GCM10017044_13270 [Kordiimonas sediminis]|uniref:histidine kinase n=1 Tax=Kordiimonas sediminis TaxID=1735581 RepID=A0A919AQS2_9PROT|nr:HAMP domain-containing sensor histidine kinase [Kordiimonas sediminis]GHF19849.1 hypothetical protein GCM10017044_13270 [Kordiimonas sediminis]
MAIKDLTYLADDLFSDLAGRQFVELFTERLARETALDIVFVGILSPDGTQVTTFCAFEAGKKIANFTYDLADSPCENVLEGGYCVFPEKIAEKFPDDLLLKEMKIEGYAGYPLRSKTGKVIGIFVGLSRQKINYDDNLLSHVHLVANRLAAELEEIIRQDKLELSLQQTERSNLTKTIFLSNAAREMREPLEAIRGFSELIRGTKMPMKEIQSAAAEITVMAEEMLAQLNDLSSLSSLDLSGGELLCAPYDIIALLKSVKLTMLGSAVTKGIDIAPIEAPEPIRVLGDAAVTKRALLNILMNCVKYMGRGKITLSAERQENGDAVITIADNGNGMSAEVYKKAMEPIDKIGDTYEAHKDGTGLGIPLTRLILSKQNVGFDLQSELGKGTTVQFLFPASLVLPVEEDDFI